MGIADGTQVSQMAKEIANHVLMAGPDKAGEILRQYQLRPDTKLAAFLAQGMVEAQRNAQSRQEALANYNPNQPTVLEQLSAPQGVAGMPTSREMFDPSLHAQGIGAVEEPTGPVARAAGGGIIAFNEGGNPAERSQEGIAGGVQQPPSIYDILRRREQQGLVPTPDIRDPLPPGMSLDLEAMRKWRAEQRAKYAPQAPAATQQPVVQAGPEKRFPPAVPQGVDRATPSTAYDKIAEMNNRQTRTPLPDQMPYVNVVQGAELLAALPDAARNGMLKNARDTGLKEFTVNYPGANGELVKGTVVLGEPKQQAEAPARTIAKPDVDSGVTQKLQKAQSLLDNILQDAQQAGPPKTMGQYVGDITGALKEAGVSGEVGTEAEANIRANLAKVSDDKKFALGMAIAQAGFAAAAGKSQYALSNIAEGFGIGVKQYTSAMADIKKAQREEEKALADIQMARRGEKLKIGTAAYEQRQKDIDTATKRLDEARKTQAVVTTNLANAVMDKESADLRTGAMLDQNLITQLNNLGIKEDAQRVAIMKETGERFAKTLARTTVPLTPQQEDDLRRRIFEGVVAETKALGVGVTRDTQPLPAPAAPTRKPGFEMVGVR